MSLVESLEEMRCGISGCSLVSFGDLSTGLALRTSASGSLKQDYLDEILQQAAVSFEASDAIAALAGRPAAENEVLIATPREMRVFVRAEGGLSDVVFCVCENADELGEIRDFAQKIFREMAEAA